MSTSGGSGVPSSISGIRGRGSGSPKLTDPSRLRNRFVKRWMTVATFLSPWIAKSFVFPVLIRASTGAFGSFVDLRLLRKYRFSTGGGAAAGKTETPFGGSALSKPSPFALLLDACRTNSVVDPASSMVLYWSVLLFDPLSCREGGPCLEPPPPALPRSAKPAEEYKSNSASLTLLNPADEDSEGLFFWRFLQQQHKRKSSARKRSKAAAAAAAYMIQSSEPPPPSFTGRMGMSENNDIISKGMCYLYSMFLLIN